VTSRALLVSDGFGRELWRKVFERDLASSSQTVKTEVPEPWVGDVDGDGETEILFAVPKPPDNALICYSAEGREKWRFASGRAVRTRKETFANSYALLAFRVFRFEEDGAYSLVAVSSHAPYYPCQVALLSSDGRLISEYWHSGHLVPSGDRPDVLDLDGDGRKELLLGGVSNGNKAATLVVLDQDSIRGVSQEENQDYQILGMPPANERCRILFARSCLNRQFDVFNRTCSVSSLPGNILIGVEELPGPENAGVAILFFFDGSLRLQKADVLEQFKMRHQALFEEGRVHHRYNELSCVGPDRLRYLKRFTPAR